MNINETTCTSSDHAWEQEEYGCCDECGEFYLAQSEWDGSEGSFYGNEDAAMESSLFGDC